MLALESLDARTLTISFGDHGDRVTPVPIPNTEVKLYGADGTAGVTLWESRLSLPALYKPPLRSEPQGRFLLGSRQSSLLFTGIQLLLPPLHSFADRALTAVIGGLVEAH